MKSKTLLLAAIITTVLTGGIGSISHASSMTMRGMDGGMYSVPVTSLKEARFKSTMRQQYDFSCGSAAVATLLSYQYGYPVNEQAVFEEMFAQGDQQKIQQEGFSLLDIKSYLESHGFRADGFEMPLEKLEGARLPAIVLINEKGYHHFVVIKGIRGDRVLIGDPSTGTRAIPKSRFESIWVNQLLFVVHNKRHAAKFNESADWRVTPKAPLETAVNRDGLGNVTIFKRGPSDF